MEFFDWEFFFGTHPQELPGAEEPWLPSELAPGVELGITLGFMLAGVLCLL